MLVGDAVGLVLTVPGGLIVRDWDAVPVRLLLVVPVRLLLIVPVRLLLVVPVWLARGEPEGVPERLLLAVSVSVPVLLALAAAV
jgi:hypothetical protein